MQLIELECFFDPLKN